MWILAAARFTDHSHRSLHPDTPPMKILENTKVRTRLTAGFLAVFLLVGIASVVGIWKIVQLGAVVDQLVTDHAAKLATAERWEKGIAVNLVRTRTSLLLQDQAVIAPSRAR
jgi:hypothetical protein